MCTICVLRNLLSPSGKSARFVTYCYNPWTHRNLTIFSAKLLREFVAEVIFLVHLVKQVRCLSHLRIHLMQCKFVA